jgi:hypothetical protein
MSLWRIARSSEMNNFANTIGLYVLELLEKIKAVNVLDSLLNPSPICAPAADTNCTITAQETEKESAYVD